MHMLLYYLMSVKILSLISAERLTRRFFIVTSVRQVNYSCLRPEDLRRFDMTSVGNAGNAYLIRLPLSSTLKAI